MEIPKVLEIISFVFIVFGPVMFSLNGGKWIKDKPNTNLFIMIGEFLLPKDQIDAEGKAKDKKEFNRKLRRFYLNRAGWVIFIFGALIQVIALIAD